MSAVASILSIILFLAFATSGLQKVIFNSAMSQSAEHLGIARPAYRRFGAIEIVGGIVLLVGVASKGSSVLAIMNEVAAGALSLAMAFVVFLHLRRRDAFKYVGPPLAMGVLALLELVSRLVQ